MEMFESVDKEEMMKTIRLFDEDAFIKEFQAQVLSCRQEGKYYVAVLDKTAFFPEGGGQAADGGTLCGKEVLDVQEKDGVIYHYLKEEISGTVCGRLHWEQRFSRMQNHTGEHIVSGIIHMHTGADNISFSLTDSETTLAFNVPLSNELLAQVEKEANAVVFSNVGVRAYYPDAETLAKSDYRSKLDLTQNVRLVEIEGTDVCACCAPHCARTGQVGLIKITGSESYKGGTKLWIQCGERALEHYTMLLGQAQEISHLLCVKIEKTATAVEKLKAAKEAAEYELVGLKRKAVAEAVAAVVPTAGNYLAVCDFRGDDLRLFADGLKDKVGGIIVVLEGDDNNGYRYVITAKETDVGSLVKEANAALTGKGGGRDNMARGSFSARLEKIKRFFEV